MKTALLKVLISILFCSLLISCSSTLDIAKRQYNSGYSITFESGNKKIIDRTSISTVVKPSDFFISKEQIVKQDSVDKKTFINIPEVYPLFAAINSEKQINILTQHEVFLVAGKNRITPASKEIKPAITLVKKTDKINKKAAMGKILLYILCIFPPFAVLFATGSILKTLLAMLLSILYYFPGLIYAIIQVHRSADCDCIVTFSNWHL